MKLEIIKFLNLHPGYGKKGPNKLRQILAKKGIYASNEDVSEALKRFKKLAKDINFHSDKGYELDEILQKEGIKSVWTMPNGEIGWSIRADKQTENKLLEDFKFNFFKELRELGSKTKQTKKFGDKGRHLLEISLPDYHFGKPDGRTIKQQSENFIDAVYTMYNRASSYDLEKVLLPIGNDFFNTDNINYTTTKGTPQRDNSQWQESFRAGWTSVVEAVNYLVERLPVDIVIVQGNHDYQKSFYLGEVLQAYFSSNTNVSVMNEINSPRKYYQYGKVLIGFTHGDKEKPHELPLLMAKEAKEMWANTDYHEWHIGHLHKHMHNEYQGVGVKMLPSLAGQDEWHKMMGYTATKRAQSYLWHKEKGLEGYIQINQ